MARAPFEVLVYPYYRTSDNEFEYAILKRSDVGLWQGVAGGGEDSETILEAAKREAVEEAGIPQDSRYLHLDSIRFLPVTEFPDSYNWGDNVYVIPQYCFGVLVQDKELVLSNEHTDYRWLKYEEACHLVSYDGDKTALWELNKRLRGRGPRG